jgi:cytochrome c peroxidase
MQKANPLLYVAALGLWASVGFQLSRPTEPEVADKVQLGEKLFFDPILSSDRSLSCASCHKPEFAFADTAQFSAGVGGHLTRRNTPTVMNSAGRLQFFWDGRAKTLEEQALKPIENAREMNLPIDEAVKRLNEDADYRKWFKKVFRALPSRENLAHAIAEYERSLETANTPYDRYINGVEEALSPAQKRGRLLFIGKANCANCHSGEDFTADRYKNIGLFNGRDLNDPGRYEITNDSTQLGHFKVPTLRNIALTAPYMHNGMFKNLRQTIEYYNEPDKFVAHSYNRDPTLAKPLELTEQEIDDLEAFLHALTDDRFLEPKAGQGR